MGVSKPRSVPPLLDIGDVSGPDDDHLGWEDILRVGEEFETGSFRAGNVNVKVSHQIESRAGLALLSVLFIYAVCCIPFSRLC
jgi:hypothetical protein